MSTAQHHVQGTPVIDPAATEPITTTAADASTDPVRPLGTDSLTAESRPEVAAALDAPTSATAPETSTSESLAKNEVVIESQPINEGILGYKAPGLVKSLIFSKKFFWFNDEPVESKHLSEYLRSEKPEIGHHNVAHASQTGKGLLFFAKRAEDKNHPAGILDLSEVSELTKGDFNDFTFKLHGQKHGFQAPTKAERDGWLVAIDAKSADAKTSREGLIGSEGYKSQIDKLRKPSAVGAASTAAAVTSRSASRPKKSLDGSKIHDGTAPTDNNVAIGGSSSDEDKTKGKGKSRSQSRKRGSIFGALLGKKEEHDEKKEVKKEDKADDKAIKQEIKAIKQEVKDEDKVEKEDDKIIKKEIQAIKREVENEDKAEKEGTTHGNTVEPAPLDAAAVAARVVGEPLVPSEGTKIAAEETTEPKAVDPATGASSHKTAPKPTKRNSIFNNLFGKKDSPTSPTTKESAPVAPTKDLEPSAVSATAPQLDDPVTTAPSEPSTTAPAADVPESAAVETPAAPTTMADPAKEKRRSSFFGNLGTKKEKKTDVISDSEEGEGKKSAPTKFGGLFRKPSRAARTNAHPSAASEAAGEPTPASKDGPSIVETPPSPAGAVPVSTDHGQHSTVSATA